MLVVLAAVSVTLMVTPQFWWHKLISLIQVIVPFQHAAEAGMHRLDDVLADDVPSLTPDQYDELLRARAAAEHQVAALTLRIEELEREVGVLTATRLWNADGRAIGARGRLIPARILTGDMAPWRSSRLLTAGTVQGVQRGASVLSDYFTIDRGAESRITSGQAILSGESLIGLVVQTGTHTSRVQLLSDPATQMKVRLGRFEDDVFRLADGYFWLVGRGGGVMEIRDVKKQDVDAGRLRIGDRVLADPASTGLPTALVVGRVAEVITDPRKPLFATLIVEPAVDPASLRRVYVFDPGGE